MKSLMLKSRFLFKRNEVIIFICMALLLPVLIFIYGTRAFTSEFNDGFTRGVKLEADRLIELRNSYRTAGQLDKLAINREIIANYFDIFALLGLLTGSAFKFLYAGHIIKLGLSCLAAYILFNKTVCVEKIESVVLALAYSLFSVSLTYGQLSSVHNLICLLPVIVILVDRYLRANNVKTFLQLSVGIAILFISGPTGVVVGAPFVFVVFVLVALCRYKGILNFLSDFGGGVLATLLSVLLSAFAVIPRFIKAPLADHSDAKGVNYKTFDFLTSLIDGKNYGAIKGQPVAFTLGMLVLLLIVLAYVNPLIPYRLKVFFFVVATLYHLSSSFKLWDSYVDIYDGEQFGGARMACLALFMLFLAAISLKNIRSITKNNIYFAIFLLLGLIVLSNNSSLEKSPSIFALYFSGTVVILFGSMFINVFIKHDKRSRFIFILAIFEIAINLHQVTPKSIIGINELNKFDCGSSVTEVTDTTSYDLPLLDKNGKTYLVLSSDVSSFDPPTIPDAYNGIMRSALLPDLFDKANYDITYSSGITDSDNDMFLLNNPGKQSEINFRFLVEEGTDYYISANNNSKVYITESNAVSDIVTVFDDSVFYKFETTNGIVNVRYATTSEFEGYVSINIWQVKADSINSVNSAIASFDGRTINDKADREVLKLQGPKTIITSIPYNSNISASVGGKDAKTSNYKGLLAVTFVCDGSGKLPTVKIGVTNADFVIGIILSVVGLAIIVATIYINKVLKNKENPSDIQTNN